MKCTKRNLMRDMPGYQGDDGTISEQCLRYVQSTEPRKAFHQMIAYLGGRGYNPFLDYGLLTLRLATYLKSYALWAIQKDDQAIITVMEKVPYYLLYDDRHDLWQNLPYLLDKITTGPEVWLNFCHILISCINEDGTGDVHLKWTYKQLSIALDNIQPGIVEGFNEADRKLYHDSTLRIIATAGWTEDEYLKVLEARLVSTSTKSMSDKEQYQIWIVGINRWYFGSSESWVYLIAAQTDTDAIEVAKKDCGYDWRHRNQPTSLRALWKFHVQLFEPNVSTMMKISYQVHREVK